MKPFVVGISGGSASGKTTFSNKLAESLEQLKVLVLHMDNYFLPFDKHPMIEGLVNKISYRDDNTPNAFDLEKLQSDLQNQIEKQEYDVIILEGLLTLTDNKIVSMLDFKIFIDCQNDERIVRRLKRNMKERGLSFDEIANVYLDVVRYLHNEYVEPYKWRADIILNGSNFSNKALEMITSYIIDMKG